MQYLSNVGFSTGYTTPHQASYLKNYGVALANPTPFARTVAYGGRRRNRRKRTRKGSRRRSRRR